MSPSASPPPAARSRARADLMRIYAAAVAAVAPRRVMARALAADPPILLMDEPFGALDPLTRAEVQCEFQDLQRRLRKTMVIVTHHVAEALLLGNRIGVIDAGALVGLYTPKDFMEATEPVTAAYTANVRMFEKLEGPG